MGPMGGSTNMTLWARPLRRRGAALLAMAAGLLWLPAAQALSCLEVAGDVNGDGAATIADVQCALIVSLWALEGYGATAPGCAAPIGRADLNCDGAFSVADVQIAITLALGSPLPLALDPDGDGCVDACAAEPNYPPIVPPAQLVAHWTAAAAVVVDLAATALDPDGDPISLVEAGPAALGQVSLVGDGVSAEYGAPPLWVGADSVPYVVTDGQHEVSATMEVEVYNHAPIAHDAALTAHWRLGQDGLWLAPLANDVDPDPEDTLTLLEAGPASAGSVFEVHPDAIFITPEPKFLGVLPLHYIVTDGLAEDSAWFFLELTNEPPLLMPFSVTAHWRDALEGIDIAPLEHASDPDPEDQPHLSLFAVGPPLMAAHGTSATQQGDLVRYQTAAPWTGLDGFSATVTDNVMHSHLFTSTAEIEVLVYNHPPVAAPDGYAVPAGATATLPVLSNDTDPDVADVPHLSVEDVWVVAGGAPGLKVSPSGDGRAVVFRAPPGASGVVELGYQVSDGLAAASTTVTITLGPPHAVTTPDHIALFGRQTELVDVLRNDRLPKGAAVALELLELPAGLDGQVVELEVEPKAEGQGDADARSALLLRCVAGSAQQASVVYGVSWTDGAGITLSYEGQVYAQVHQHPPLALEDHVAAAPGGAAEVRPLGNDFDLDGDPLSVLSIGPPSCGWLEPAPAHDGGLEPADPSAPGALATRWLWHAPKQEPADALTPGLPAAAATCVAPYVVSDGHSAAEGVITLRVEPSALAVVPDVFPVLAAADATLGVLANDWSEAGASLSVLAVDPPDAGAAIGEDGAGLRFEDASAPDAGWSEVHTDALHRRHERELSYVAGDGAHQGDERVWVQRLDFAPLAVPDEVRLKGAGPHLVDPLHNDRARDGQALALHAAISEHAGVLVSVSADGARLEITLDPSATKAGPHLVHYTVTDGHFTASAWVRLHLEAP